MMSKKPALIVIFTVIATLVFFLSCYLSLPDYTRTPLNSQARSGKTVWEKSGCIECHTLFGNGGYLAPDLTYVLSEKNTDWLQQFLTNPPVMRPARKRLHPALSEADAKALLSYFRYLEQLNTLAWPPIPVVKP